MQHLLWVFSFNGWKTVKCTHSCLVNSYEYPFHLKVLLCYIRSRRGTSYVKCIFKFLVCGHLLWCLVLPLKCGFVSLWRVPNEISFQSSASAQHWFWSNFDLILNLFVCLFELGFKLCGCFAYLDCGVGSSSKMWAC